MTWLYLYVPGLVSRGTQSRGIISQLLCTRFNSTNISFTSTMSLKWEEAEPNALGTALSSFLGSSCQLFQSPAQISHLRSIFNEYTFVRVLCLYQQLSRKKKAHGFQDERELGMSAYHVLVLSHTHSLTYVHVIFPRVTRKRSHFK